ncbi:O-antigen ligase family protein [Planctomycetota bacterium]
MDGIYINHHIYESPPYMGRKTDITLDPFIDKLLLVGWGMICLISLGIIFILKAPIIGIVFACIPTFIGMVLKPSFALCLLMIALPVGTGIAVGNTFTLNKGVGYAVALSFLINLMMTRPSLDLRNKVLWLALAYFLWTCFSSLIAPYINLEIQRIFTQVQLMALFFIVYWILTTNTPKTLIWMLRSFVLGSVVFIIISIATGATMRVVEEGSQGRYTATLGNAINANLLAALIALSLLCAVYLFLSEKSIIWKFLYLGSTPLLAVMLIKTGSRGAIIALGLTLVSPIFFLLDAKKYTKLLFGLMFAMLLLVATVGYYFTHAYIEKDVFMRLTDIGYAKESIALRMETLRYAVEASVRWPFGTGHIAWFERSGASLFPHNDLFFILGIYGIPGAFLFVFLVLGLLFSVKKVPSGHEKLISRSILIFLLIIGLKGMYISTKFYWIFLAISLSYQRLSVLFCEQEQSYSSQDEDYIMAHDDSLA